MNGTYLRDNTRVIATLLSVANPIEDSGYSQSGTFRGMVDIMNRMPQNRLVLVSVDGLSVRELERVRTLPSFKALLERGALSTGLRSVFPSLTYVVHATMLTGRHPETHGVTHNHPLQPGVPVDDQRWFWYADEVKSPTLFDLAREAGLTTAAVLWPLVARGKITWNFPEISALPGENLALKVMKSGTLPYLLDLQLRFGKYRKGDSRIELDDFVGRAAAYTIRTKRPRFLATHLLSLDAMKHDHGSESLEAALALEAIDAGLGRVLDAIDAAGLADETTVVVIGDHGHIDTTRRVRLNRLLEDAGLCGGNDGSFSWRAWCRCSGGSAFLHARDGDARSRALAVLHEAALAPLHGVDSIAEGEALARLRSDRDAAAALLAKPGVQFVEDRDGPIVEDAPAPGAFGADHGYHPDQDAYRTLFAAAGPGIAPGAALGDMEMTDVAPTLARVLGLRYPDCDGRVVPGLFGA